MNQAGFTMMEVVISVTVITIITGILTVAFPAQRDHQALVITEQQVQAVVREAQQRALNEVRPEDCLPVDAESERRACSNVGVAVADAQLVLFADTVADGQYRAGDDYVIQQQALPPALTVTRAGNYIFYGVPPLITLDGRGSDGPLVLQSGRETLTLRIKSYGQVERE